MDQINYINPEEKKMASLCDLKSAHAGAMAEVFRGHGINASAGSKLD